MKVRKSPKTSSPSSKPARAAEPAKPAAKGAAPADKFTRPAKSHEKIFPRQAWNDGAALGAQLDKARAKTAGGKKTHPRLTAAHHRKPGTRPVIVARYGLPTKPGGNKPGPVIVARYGLPTKPGGGGNPGPVIVARYGLPTKPGGGGGKPSSPVIVARYGLPTRPGKPTPSHPDNPVIVARYGLPTRPK